MRISILDAGMSRPGVVVALGSDGAATGVTGTCRPPSYAPTTTIRRAASSASSSSHDGATPTSTRRPRPMPRWRPPSRKANSSTGTFATSSPSGAM